MATGPDHEIDELYALPPAEFVRARNALAARLRLAGQGDRAAEVKRLPRPSATVWAINRTARDEPKSVAELVDAVTRLERAQGGHSRDLHEAIERERRARQHAVRLATARLTAAGGRATPETVRRLSATLLGAAGDRSARDDLTHGRLTEDRQATGFDLLSATPMRSATERPRRDEGSARRHPPAKVVTLPLPRRRAAEEEARRRREEEQRARKAARRAERESRDRRRRAAALEAKAARHRRSAERAEREAEKLRVRLRLLDERATDETRAAAEAVEGARRVRNER